LSRLDILFDVTKFKSFINYSIIDKKYYKFAKILIDYNCYIIYAFDNTYEYYELIIEYTMNKYIDRFYGYDLFNKAVLKNVKFINKI
jgi:hypothetical protein